MHDSNTGPTQAWPGTNSDGDVYIVSSDPDSAAHIKNTPNDWVFADATNAHNMFLSDLGGDFIASQAELALPASRANGRTDRTSKLWLDFLSADANAAVTAYEDHVYPVQVARLPRRPTYDGQVDSPSARDKYRDKIRYEVSKFFVHAKKWIHKRTPQGGEVDKKITYHFTYSFTFDDQITSHIQAWIKWLYYVIKQLESSYENGETAPTPSTAWEYGWTHTHNVAYDSSTKTSDNTHDTDHESSASFWSDELYTLESETWNMVTNLNSIDFVWGSVTLTQNFDELDNLAIGPWPGHREGAEHAYAEGKNGNAEITAFPDPPNWDNWFDSTQPVLGYRNIEFNSGHDGTAPDTVPQGWATGDGNWPNE